MNNTYPFKVGDIVTCYYKGYYRIMGFSTPTVVELKSVLSSKLTKGGTGQRCSLGINCCEIVHKEELLERLTKSIELVNEVFDEEK